MPRRALRKTDPGVELADWLYTGDELPRPLDMPALFPRSAPLEIEVGSGKGLFLRAASKRWPERNFLGIEVAHKYAEFAAARLAKDGRDNARVIDGDALRLLADAPDAVAAALHVYFPDPWWKKRHKKRRVMNDRLLKDIERLLEPGGRLHFWTDVREYFQSTLKLISQVTTLAGPFEVPESPAEHDLDYRTHFERRMRQAGLLVYRSEFRKPEKNPTRGDCSQLV
jgi:tRNA (guanine-N7-)-methyltransferase